MFCEESSKWSIFGAFVIDFSFASIHAACRAFNQTDFVSYLSITYDACIGKIVLSKNFVTIHLCCAHFLKMVSKDVDKHFSDKSNRKNKKYEE